MPKSLGWVRIFLESQRLHKPLRLPGEVCGVDVAALAREGSAEQVNDAYNAQVLAAALSVGLSHALDARGIQAEAMLGFSLGQISALMASGRFER